MPPEQTLNTELLAGFCEESLDLLQGVPESLTQYANEPSDAEAMNVIFRSVHTIKGNAGFFGLNTVKGFSHSLEDTFDLIRQGKTQLQEKLCRYLVEGIDSLGEMIIQVQEHDADANKEDRHDVLLEQIKSLCSVTSSDTAEQQLLREVLQLADEIAATQVPQANDWSLRLRTLANADSDQNKDADSAVEQTEQQEVSTHLLSDSHFECDGTNITDQVQPLLTLFLAIESGGYQQKDGETFLSDLEKFSAWATEHGQVDLAAELNAAHEDFYTLFSSPLDIDQMLISVVWDRLGPALDELRGKEPEAPSSTDETDASTEISKENSPAKQATNTEHAVKTRYLRVREERVDDFLDDVSSLFITCERLKDLQSRMAELLKRHNLVDELRQINASLSGQSTALQRSVVELRKVPVRGLFSKFPRVARSLATKLGKQLNVHLAGEEIEIDKSLVEDLDGPLMHMIRNVCDHGIDTPEEREARKESAAGNLHLECSLTKSHVVITVADDGRGIDPNRLRNKAVENGLYTAEEATALTDQKAVELVFNPGLSTANEVTDISGRGVGLDVVRTRLREHEGDVSVTSTVGKGTTFRLEIPIRRAVVVIDGLLVTQGDTTFVIPFEHIQEILRIDHKEMSSVQGQMVTTVRGEPYAAVGLDKVLEIDSSLSPDDHSREGALIKSNTGTMFLMVDSVLAQRKVVINNLSFEMSECETISGVAQLGAGKLALVLNVPELVNAASQNDTTGFE